MNFSFLFPLDVRRPFDSIWLCIAACPTRTLTTLDDLREYARESGISLCTYDIVSLARMNDADESNLGPCPVLDVHKRSLSTC